MEEPGGLQSLGSRRVGHDWTTNTHNPLISPHVNKCLKGPSFHNPFFPSSQSSFFFNRDFVLCRNWQPVCLPLLVKGVQPHSAVLFDRLLIMASLSTWLTDFDLHQSSHVCKYSLVLILFCRFYLSRWICHWLWKKLGNFYLCLSQYFF